MGDADLVRLGNWPCMQASLMPRLDRAPQQEGGIDVVGEASRRSPAAW